MPIATINLTNFSRANHSCGICLERSLSKTPSNNIIVLHCCKTLLHYWCPDYPTTNIKERSCSFCRGDIYPVVRLNTLRYEGNRIDSYCVNNVILRTETGVYGNIEGAVIEGNLREQNSVSDEPSSAGLTDELEKDPGIMDLDNLVKEAKERNYSEPGYIDELPVQACRLGDEDMIRKILELDPDIVNRMFSARLDSSCRELPEDVYLLQVAAENERATFVDLLIKKGARVGPAISQAAENENSDNHEKLISTIIKSRDDHSGILEQLLNENDTQSIASLHCGGIDTYQALENAIVKENIPYIESLNASGVNINLELFFAAYFYGLFGDREKDIKILLKAGAGGIETMAEAAKDDNLYVITALAKFHVSKNNALCLASGKGWQNAVRCLLESGAKAQCLNDRGESPLYLAAENGRTEVAKILLQSGSSGEDALALAVRSDSLAAVNKLLECHVDPNDCLERLLKTSVHNKNKDIVNALSRVSGGSQSRSEMLLNTFQNRDREALLTILDSYDDDKKYREDLNAMAKKGVVESTEKEDFERLMKLFPDGPHAKEFLLSLLIVEVEGAQDLHRIRTLLDNGADGVSAMVAFAEQKKKSGINVLAISGVQKSHALYRASREGNLQAVTCLLAVREKSDDLVLPLYCAAARDHGDVVKLLNNECSGDGIEAMNFAIQNEGEVEDSRQAITTLLQCGVNPNGNKECSGVESPMIVAAGQQRSDILNTFCKAGGDLFRALFYAFRQEHKDALFTLLDFYEKHDYVGYILGFLSIIQSEIEEEIKKEIKEEKVAGKESGLSWLIPLCHKPSCHLHNVFILAIKLSNETVVEYLLKKCRDLVEARSSQGDHALIYAADQKNPNIIQMLVTAGSPIDKANNKGETALTRAAYHKNDMIMDILLSHKASISSALQGFAYRGSIKAFEKLLQKDNSCWNGELCRKLMRIAAGQGKTDFIKHLLERDQACELSAGIACFSALREGAVNESKAFSQIQILRDAVLSPLLHVAMYGQPGQAGCLIEAYPEEDLVLECYQLACAQETGLLRRLVQEGGASAEKVQDVIQYTGTIALKKNHQKALLSLVESGLASAGIQDLLLQAVAENNPDAVRLLLLKMVSTPDFPMVAAQCLSMAIKRKLTASMDNARVVGGANVANVANRETVSVISSVLEALSTNKMVETIVTVLTEAGKKIGPLLDGLSLLGTAIEKGNIDIIDLVYRVTDDKDREAQMWQAAVQGRSKVVKQLIECGAGFDNIVSRGVQKKNTKVLETLSNAGISLGNHLQEAALNGDKESVEVFLAANIQLEYCAEEDGAEALYQIACQQREVAAMMVRHWQRQSADNKNLIDIAIVLASSESNHGVLNFLEDLAAEDNPLAGYYA